MEKVKELNLSKGMYYIKGTKVFQMKPKKVVANFGINDKEYIYFVKNGDLYRAKRKN